MNYSISSSRPHYQLSKVILIALCFAATLLPTNYLFSLDSGGYTDPVTPGRHSKLNVDSANIAIIPHGIYAQVTTEFWYRSVDLNKVTDTLEMYLHFNLPPTDFVNDSWLWVEDTLVQAMIIDVDEATLIYEDIVHRLHKDPSILYRRNTTGKYEYRIYPNVGSKSRHAKISYYTKLNYSNSTAQFTFSPTILNISVNREIPRNIRFYLNNNFGDVDFGANPPQTHLSSDNLGDYIEYKTSSSDLSIKYPYLYDFSTPYFSKSNLIDGEEYYFTMFDCKLLTSNYIPQKINFLIDYDINRTSVTSKEVIDQLKKVILSNFNSSDSINIMIGDKQTQNLFDRWVPCSKDSIEYLIDSLTHKKIGHFSYLADLMIDGVKFNMRYKDNSSIILLTSSEYAATPTTANPVIENCMKLMKANVIEITTVDFSDIHYSTYNINSKNYYGGQYFNEKISEMTKGDYYSTKGTKSTILSMLSNAFAILKGSVTDLGLYVEPTDGISFAETTQSIVDVNSNNKLIYEYGRLIGEYPIEVKFSALLDGKPVIKNYLMDESNITINNESAKIWNWDYIRVLENKTNRTKKEREDLLQRSISNRVLSTHTAFLCLEPWMMRRDSINDEIEDPTSVLSSHVGAGLEIKYGPNPIVNNLNIELIKTNLNTKILSVKIYDILGSIVKEFEVNAISNSISLSWDTYSNNGKVPPGVYYLVIETNSGRKSFKLVIL